MEFLLPTIQKTGEVATLKVTARPSSRMPAVVNFRFALPRRALTVNDGAGHIVALPEHDGQGGLPVVQFPAVMN